MRRASAPCPYVGIRPFGIEERDLAYFFGREREISVISSNVSTAALTILYGLSGVGKSSVLQAGVVPHLRKIAGNKVIYLNDWQNDSVVAENEQLMKTLLGLSIGENTGSNSGSDSKLATGRTLGRIAILLDQFEEYLTRPITKASDYFESTLARVINSEDARIGVLISLREDGLARLDERMGLRVPDLYTNTLQVKHLGRYAAERAIREPLRILNEVYNEGSELFEIEDDLVNEILSKIQTKASAPGEGAAITNAPSQIAEPGIETAFLQLVMKKLWSEERSRDCYRFKLSTLQSDDVGGVANILQSYVDEIMEKDLKSDSQKDVAAAIFRYLVTPSGSKFPQSPRDLALYADLAFVDVMEVLKLLSVGDETRILRRLDNPERFEIFHDVLGQPILDWRSRYVLAKELQTAQHRAAEVLMAAKAKAAEEARQAADELKLQQALEFASEQKRRADAERELANAERQRANAIALAQSRLTLLLIGGFVFALLALFFLVRTVINDWHGTESRRLSLKSKNDVDSSRKAILALEAVDQRRTAEAEEALDSAIQGRYGYLYFGPAAKDDSSVVAGRELGAGVGEIIRFVGLSQDGTLVATAGTDEKTELWQPYDVNQTGLKAIEKCLEALPQPDPQNPYGTPKNPLAPEAARNCGQAANAGNGSGVSVLSIWVAHNLKQLAELSQILDANDTLSGLALSANGKVLVTATHYGKATIWDLATRTSKNLPSQYSSVTATALSSDGGVLAIADIEKVEVWNTNTLVRIFSKTQTSPARTIAISSDGNRVAVGDSNMGGSVWQSKTGELLRPPLEGHTQNITTILFSPDGSLVATGSADSTARLWDVKKEGGSRPLAHDAPVFALAFGHDGKSLATATVEGNVAIWNAQSAKRMDAYREYQKGIVSLYFDPQDKFLTWITGDGKAHVHGVTIDDMKFLVSDVLNEKLPLSAQSCESILNKSLDKSQSASEHTQICQDVSPSPWRRAVKFMNFIVGRDDEGGGP